MEIKVFGPGCAKCTETENLVKEVAAAKGGNITVQKVSDLKEMMAAGVMSTPAVAIDGVVKSTGKIPTKKEVAAWIDGAAGSAPSAAPAGGSAAAATANWWTETVKHNPVLDASDDALVCYCGNVTKGMLLAAVAKGCSTFQQLREATGVCPDNNDCASNNPSGKCCSPEVMALLQSHVGAAVKEFCGCGCCTNNDS